MKVDRIYRNGEIFTSNTASPSAACFAVKDGKFVYVGDEAGLAAYEGEVIDLGGRFVMPAILDSHCHICTCIANDYVDFPEMIPVSGKENVLRYIADRLKENPGKKLYRFMIGKDNLGGTVTYRDLDAISTEAQITLNEAVGHSEWVNSKVLRDYGITEESEDIAPNLSYYERDENGKLTGYLVEMCHMPVFMTGGNGLTDEQIIESLKRFFNYCKSAGISCVFDAGMPSYPGFNERVMRIICEMDARGEVPITIEGSYMIFDPRQINGEIEKLKSWDRMFHTKHVRVRTMKILLDGIEAARSAYMLTPYEGTDSCGGRVCDEVRLAAFLEDLNKEGIDLHLHTVGEGAVKTVTDAVENARNKLGDDFRIKVTCAHLGVVRPQELAKIAELGIQTNWTPSWNGGNSFSNLYETAKELLGEDRARNEVNRTRTVYDSGALVTFSSDTILFANFSAWSPYLGMEIGIARKDVEAAKILGGSANVPMYPPKSECMTIEQMLLGYTINGAIQLRIDDHKGSIDAGKDADFLVFEENLLNRKLEGFHSVLPAEVWFEGKNVKPQ